uniref:Uncharacterized protein n=1 Tax=Glossina palpalis gambiensis TaxID=67801 RepID=A0A1B0B2P7_9MUSC
MSDKKEIPSSQGADRYTTTAGYWNYIVSDQTLLNAGDDDNVDDCVCICVDDDDEVGVKQLPFNKDFLRKCFVNILLNVMKAGNDKNNHMFLGNSFISSRQKTDDNDNKTL